MRMNSIYANSVLNLAASDSTDAYGGLVRSRPSPLARPCPIIPRWTTIEFSTHSPYSAFDPDLWRKEILTSALYNRAWVVQERILSPRTLHFGATRLFWECRLFCVSKGIPNNLPRSSLTSKNQIKRRFYMQMLGLRARKTRNEAAMFQAWVDVVTLYSECGLTRISDKLVAIEGVAQAIGLHLVAGQSSYLKGMWVDDWGREMLWNVSNPRRGKSREFLRGLGRVSMRQ